MSDAPGLPVLRDKTGRPIERGDILKVFHFTGGRRKRHFMYKQAIGTKALNSGTVYMMFSHLEMDDQYYLEQCDGRCLADYEIVQSIDAEFHHRPREVPSPSPIMDAFLAGAKYARDQAATKHQEPT